VLGLHALCCGAPVAAAFVASGAVGLTGFALVETATHDLHEVLHHHELWLLAISAVLVGVGGLAEWAARRRGQGRGFPAFFAVSVACFALNAALIVNHRLPEAHAAHAEPVVSAAMHHDHP